MTDAHPGLKTTILRAEAWIPGVLTLRKGALRSLLIPFHIAQFIWGPNRERCFQVLSPFHPLSSLHNQRSRNSHLPRSALCNLLLPPHPAFIGVYLLPCETLLAKKTSQALTHPLHSLIQKFLNCLQNTLGKMQQFTTHRIYTNQHLIVHFTSLS